MKIKSHIYKPALVIVLIISVLVGYKLVDRALCDHAFSSYASDGNATYLSDGTKTAFCDNGCGKKDRVNDNGSRLKLSKPTQLTAEQTTEAVTLTWNEVEGATGYDIYREYEDGQEELVISTKKTEHTVDKLEPASKLRFNIKAYIKDGKDVLRAEDSAVIYTSTKCTVVENITSTSSSSAVKLTWDEVKGADGYCVYIKDADKWQVVGEHIKKTAYTVKKLSSYESYTFAVRSYVETDSIVFSEYVSYEAKTKLKAPETKIELTSKDEITLSFEAVDKADGYQVYRKIDSGKYELYKELDNAESISISLKPDKYYTFAVRGYVKEDGEIVSGDYEPEKVHCSDTGDRLVIDPSEGDWNLVLVNKKRELPQSFSPKLADIPDGYSMDYRAAVYYNVMYADAAEEGIYLTPVSGYRSNELQQEIFDESVEGYIYSLDLTRAQAEKKTSTEVLIPGTSEHNLALAVDVGCVEGYFEDSDEYQWLLKNAHKYGFIERYTEEKQKITGIIPEPWHWRYVGVEYAEDIKNSGLCLEEYLEKYNLIP